MHCVVIVLGDVGRSPRMQYHALSLANTNLTTKVTLIGYCGEKTLLEISEHPKINVIRFNPPELPSWLRKISSLVHAVIKGIALLLQLILLLLFLPRYDLILAQNPPCLPSLLANAIVNPLRIMVFARSPVVLLDWHNLGFSMFHNSINSKSLLVRIARAAEYIITSSAFVDRHICVSREMMAWLIKNFDIDPSHIRVFYDRPFHITHSNNSEEDSLLDRHRLLQNFKLTDAIFSLSSENQNNYNCNSDSTIQTETVIDKQQHEVLRLRPDRAIMIISSTSWTPDEDFGILVEAMKTVDKYLQEINQHLISKSTPIRIVVIVTGKGPLKSQFEELFQRMESSKEIVYVRFRTVWLSPEDYPKMIALADIGVCLHTSSSGLDLPMKVLDMFGAGVPVCAVNFPTISELIKHNENGVVFDSHADLAKHLIRLLLPASHHPSLGCSEALGRMKRGAASIESWNRNWKEFMLPVLTTCQQLGKRKNENVSLIAFTIKVFSILLAIIVMKLKGCFGYCPSGSTTAMVYDAVVLISFFFGVKIAALQLVNID